MYDSNFNNGNNNIFISEDRKQVIESNENEKSTNLSFRKNNEDEHKNTKTYFNNTNNILETKPSLNTTANFPANDLNENNFKSKVEKDMLDSQISSLKQTMAEEKQRFEILLNEEREKYKKREIDNNKFIESIRDRSREELNTMEEKYKVRIDSLNEENRRIRNEIDKEIQSERERLNILHKSDLENQNQIFSKNLEQKEKFFNEQNEILKKQLQQQIEFNKLASKVEDSSKQIDGILSKYFADKEKNNELEKYVENSKENFLKEREDKIITSEKMLNLEKENMLKIRQDFEFRELEKKKELQEEKNKISLEFGRLQELQNTLKVLEFNAKEKYEREKMDFMQKQTEMKSELDSLKNDFNQKMTDLEYQKRILNEEKNFFEKYKDEAIK